MAPFRRCSSGINSFTNDIIGTKYNANSTEIAPKRCIFCTTAEIWCKFHKGSGTKLHKSLVGSLDHFNLALAFKIDNTKYFFFGK